jgi:formate-dependent nitrite reductase cytochrome c552 subunit
MSSYHEETDHALWDVTSGHPPHPATARDYLGLPLTSDAARLCFDCHVTNPQAVLTGKGPEALDPAIGCERCHGPGGNHSLAVAARFPDLAIGRPSAASGPQVVKICAQCHSPRGMKVEMSDPHSPRFAATTLTWSRCYTESKELLSCITCHDPHRDAVTTHAHYEAKCLACHPSGGSGAAPADPAPPRERRRRFDLADAPRAHPCPVNPSTGCIDCHMPQVKNVVPHSTFTDHNIRIHEARPGEAAESGKSEETR